MINQQQSGVREKVNRAYVEHKDRALEVTINIFEMVNRTIILLPSNEINNDIKKICMLSHIECIDGIEEYASPEYTVLDGHHWNELGNEAVGRHIIEYLYANDMIEKN